MSANNHTVNKRKHPVLELRFALHCFNKITLEQRKKTAFVETIFQLHDQTDIIGEIVRDLYRFSLKKNDE